MADSHEKRLLDRIHQLEQELKEREQDISHFKSEITKLNEQLGGFISQVTQELKAAHAIQKSLVPTEIPTIPGFDFSTKFQSGTQSGGDYFDFFDIGDKFRFGIILASSSGYGMSALLLSVLLKLSGQLQAKQGKKPHEVLELMLKELVPNIKGDVQSSILFAVVDRKHYEMSYASIGNILALRWEPESTNLSEIVTSSPPVQADYKGAVKTQQISLNPRDRLVFSSPGIVLTKNPEGESFGKESIFKIIMSNPKMQPHELRNEILFQAQTFSKLPEPERDLTLMVVDVRDKVIKLTRS